MPRSRKKILLPPGKGAQKADRKAPKERRSKKLEHRKKERKPFTADQWAVPAPTHLVAKLEIPKHKSRYHSYFEFAENTNKKEKKLEFQVTNNANPPPGFKFVPIGDPQLTNECKEISRELGAMIFIVSSSKEENSKVSEHIYRTGYHFRESIVDAAQEKLGERPLFTTTNGSTKVEPIPESQAEINKQADGAIRDLFPRIPHTDRQMIIEHAFKKGAQFHGEPTVGLQANIPLSRRVQLAVLAHIRHTHTRYDRLLRETTWMNARKVVEPVCLYVLVRWRGDEETGRDQLSEILREVVIITDSESSEESSGEDESSDEDGELTSSSSGRVSASSHQPQHHHQLRHSQQPHVLTTDQTSEALRRDPMISKEYHGTGLTQPVFQKEKKAQRGFRRYQAAWDQAISRQDAGVPTNPHIDSTTPSKERSEVEPPFHNSKPYSLQASPKLQYPPSDRPYYQDSSTMMSRQEPYHAKQRPTPDSVVERNETPVRPAVSRPPHHHGAPQRDGTYSPFFREQRASIRVKGSPNHGLQDMLVPSIEIGSSDASPHLPARHSVYGDFEQDSRPRFVVERQRRSPEYRQAIIIEDDSPQPKRRRVIQEDDSGRFRPLQSRDSRRLVTPQRNSHLLPVSSVPARDFLVEQSKQPSQSGQGLLKDTAPALAEPALGYRIPIYDAPPETHYYTPNIGPTRRNEVDFRAGYQRQAPQLMRAINSPHGSVDMNTGITRVVRQVDQAARPVEREISNRQSDPDFASRSQTQQRPLPTFPAPNTGPRSYEIARAVVADQAFIDRFSQSQIHPHFSRAGNGFTVPSESSHTMALNYGNAVPNYGDHSPRSAMVAHQGQERSQVQYLERPWPYSGGSRQHAFIEQSELQPVDRRPSPVREQLVLPQRNAPPNIGRFDPRRQVVIYE